MNPWLATADGATVGQCGPEGGLIVLDESTSTGVRLLLEEAPERSFYSVTAIIPDWMVHPRFFDTRAAADLAYEEMRAPLLALSNDLPVPRPPPGHKDTYAGGAKLAAFMTRYS